jgi:integrase/recombinase XerD
MITKNTQIQNIHRRDNYIQNCLVNQEKKLSKKNFETFMEYNDNMIIDSIANTTRYKNLCHFADLSKKLQKDWIDVTENDLKLLVGTIMTEHSPSGKETSYTAVLKLSLKQIVRFVKSGSRAKSDDGELKILRFIKSKRVKGKIVREDLPTDEEISKIIQACADSSRDKAMFALHADAGTRIGELLALKIKDLTIDQFGGIIKISEDGKTGTRPVRVVKSIPYLTRWLNDHPNKDDSQSPMFVYVHASDTFGNPITYRGFDEVLKKRLRQAGITRRITSHYFRHKACTDMASKLTESECRMRFGWESDSAMPARYTHLNQEDLDDKVLHIMGVKKEESKEKEMFQECVYCKIKQPLETRFCDVCSRPLDIADAIQMEKDQEKKMKSMMYELMRKERAKQSQNEAELKKNSLIEEQKEKIKQLEQILQKVT